METLNINVGGDSADVSETVEGMNCPVCLFVPKGMVYACQSCEGIICEKCVSQCVICPLCRKDLKDCAPKRSKIAERLIAAALKNEKI